MDPLNDLIEFNTLPKNQPIAMFDQNGKPRRRINFGHARRSSIPLISYSGGRAARQAQRHGGVVPGLLEPSQLVTQNGPFKVANAPIAAHRVGLPYLEFFAF